MKDKRYLDAVKSIEEKINFIRGKKVMLDRDLAELYGVTTGNLNKAVRRNIGRFPSDFSFRLTNQELMALRFQIGISKGKGGTRYLPYCFTEHGVAMLSSVLNSERAIQVNIEIMRAFVKIREMMWTQRGFWKRIEEMEKKYDRRFRIVFVALRKLLKEPEKPARKIGFGA